MAGGASLTDAQWTAAVHDRLRRVVPDLVPGRPAVAAIRGIAGDVWRLDLSDGGRVVARHQLYGLLTRGEPHDLVGLEVDLLRHLRRRGCPVPLAFGADPGSQIILLEYAGPRTLAQALPLERDPATRRRWLAKVWSGLGCIEGGLADGGWETRAAPGTSRQELEHAWGRAGEEAVEGLRSLFPAGAGAPPFLLGRLRQLHERLGRLPPRLGPTDYQPGNIVLDAGGERLTFLELSKIGWDWTPRRAVQYTTIADAEGPPETSLLDAGSVEGSGLDEASRSSLDGHHLIYHLLLARRTRRCGAGVLPRPLARKLTGPLSADPLTAGLRRHLPPKGSIE